MKITDLKIAVARKNLKGSAEKNSTEKRNFKLGIILDAENEDSIEPFIKLKEDLKLKQEEVKVVICRKKAAENVIFEYPVICLKDFGWTGKVSEEASAFLDAHYDVLISFTASENKTADFLVSVSRARLKAGRKTTDKNGIFDLNISAELSEPEVFTAELKKYLKIITQQ